MESSFPLNMGIRETKDQTSGSARNSTLNDTHPNFCLSLCLCASVVCFFAVRLAAAQEWPQLARDASHSATSPRAARVLTELRWTATPLADEEFVTDSSPVVAGGLAIINARRYQSGTQIGNRLIAFDIFDGDRVWATPLVTDAWESWSSPAIDLSNRTAILGVGSRVYACDLADGHVVWQTVLDRNVVNAAPIVTDDLSAGGVPANRVFITDYTYGNNAELYALNVDPYESTHNPYQPGEIVWTINLPGASGNTPAYADGVVYTVSIDGLVKALDAHDGSLVWQNQVDLSSYPEYTGFYGGIALHGDYAYAATYAFYGEGDNSGLFKFDLADGDVVWETPCERTNSMPVVTDDLRIYLAAGLVGYGSAIKLQAFQDQGQSATKQWDTYVDTSGALIVGGWTSQPAYSRGYLYVGEPVRSGGDAGQTYLKLYLLDTSKTPGTTGFVVAEHAAAGGSPALADATVYSLGTGGLLAFDPSPACLADINPNGVVDLADLATFFGHYGSQRWEPRFDSAADLNRDGDIDLADLSLILGVYGATCE